MPRRKPTKTALRRAAAGKSGGPFAALAATKHSFRKEKRWKNSQGTFGRAGPCKCLVIDGEAVTAEGAAALAAASAHCGSP